MRAVLLAAILVPWPLAAATFTVTSAADSGPGSLRQAILDANASPGADAIAFAIPGSGVHVLAPVTALPAVSDAATIDGYTQPGASPNTHPYISDAVLRIELAGGGTDGLTVTGGATTIRGLAMHGFQTAIAVSAQGSNVIAGNFLGTDAGGAPAGGNGIGVAITGTSFDTIGGSAPADRNLISGNTTGILLTDAALPYVHGNLIGTTAFGYPAIGNGTGIRLFDVDDAQIGGFTNGTRNIISGNLGNGIETGASLNSMTTGVVVANYVGTDVSGAGALGNGGSGIQLEKAVMTIRENVLSGNALDGANVSTSNATFFANVVGADAAASGVPIPNGRSAIQFEQQGGGSLGGALPNLIAFNPVGIWVEDPQFPTSVVAGSNSIHSNRGLGIVLGPTAAISPNAAGGSMFNFPLLASVSSAGGNTTFEGVYAGPPVANTTVFFDFYASPGCSPRPRQFDEGVVHLGGYGPIATGGLPIAFSTVLPVTLSGERVTVTATPSLHFPLQSTEGGFVQWTHTSGFSQRLPFAIDPASGPASGGTPVSITGTSFQAGAAVTIGGVAAVNPIVASDTTITAETPIQAAGAAYDVAVVNPDGTRGTLALGWIADFLDVPTTHLFHDFIVRLVSYGVAGGTGGGNYGPDQSTLRQQMAVFLLKGKHGICYVPPPCTGVFTDVPCTSPFAPWIEALLAEGITGGCGPGIYCPQDPVRRDQMAVFLLKAEHGPSYVPPPCTGVFLDVPCPGSFTDWIEQLAAESITGGCGGGNYCPFSNSTRGQMAVFLTKTFDLQ